MHIHPASASLPATAPADFRGHRNGARFQRRFLRTILVASLVVATAGCEAFRKSTEPSPIDSDAVTYDAIGASDAIGYGASDFCLPLLPCTTGFGYVQQVTRRLIAEGKTVTLNNLGWPGAVLSPQVQQLSSSIGLGASRNVLSDEAPYVRRDATLVTVFIGANDANAVGRAVLNGHGGSDPAGFVQTHIQNFARDMQTMAGTIKGRAPGARIVVLNLPNMANTPYAAGFTLSEKRVLQTLTVGFSAGINALALQGIVVVDLTCDANFYNPGIYSGDGFHPNDTGYNYLTEVVFRAIKSGSTPAASCSLMNVF